MQQICTFLARHEKTCLSTYKYNIFAPLCCIFKWKSRFSHDVPKMCNFFAFWVEKQVFSLRTKTLKFNAFLRENAGFLVTRQKGANLLHFKWKSRFSRDAPKGCKFVAFLSGKAGCLVMRQKDANLLHLLVEKQVFSWRAIKVQICYILSEKAGFLVTCQKYANLLHFKWKSRFSRDAP